MTIKIIERINEERAKFILSLSEKQRGELIWNNQTDKETNKGEPFYDQKTYLRNVVFYLKKQLANDCVLEVEYNFSKKMRTDGRLFAQQFSLQSMKKNLRGFLIGGMFSSDQGGMYIEGGADYCYKDYDMVNCHPSILGSIMLSVGIVDEDDFKDQYPYLFDYTLSIKNRKSFLERADCTKQDILKMMNSSNNTSIFNDFTVGIDKEFKRIQKIFYDLTPEELKQFEHFKGDERKPNKRGSFLNKILCIFENQILNMVVEHYKEKYPFQDTTSTLMFDGLFITSELRDQVDELNNITYDMGVEWAQKALDDSIEKSDLYQNRNINDISKIKSKDYKTIKLQFEENHFMIESPLLYVRENTIQGKPVVTMYNAGDYKMLINPIKAFNGKMEEVPIFDRWSKDETRRSYKKLDFVPTEERSDEIYNTFQGFDYSNYKNVEFEERTELIDMYRKTVSTLVDHDEPCIDYVLKYFAHMYQHPEERPDIALVFISQPGYGKDSLIDCNKLLLGGQYVYRTAKIDEIFGSFNAALKNKLIVQINELAGKDGFENKDKLKDLITQHTVNINEKNKPQYEQTNYSRIIICTNRFNSIEVASGDRRMFVAEADRIKPPSSHFTRFHELLKDPNELYSLYKYFMEYDLGDIPLRHCRPITNAYRNMQENNIHPFYIWLKDTLTDYKELIKHQTHKATGQVVITSSELFNKYSEYMEDTNQPMNRFTQKRTMKDMLSSLKVINKKTKLNGSVVSAFWFDIPVILIYLQDVVKEEEMEEYTDEDFE